MRFLVGGLSARVGKDVSGDPPPHFTNDYQSVRIHMNKAMERDEQFGIGGGNAYLSVRFGLFAAEKIAAADGTFIPENGLIATVSLREDMTAAFDQALPFGKYYVQEIATEEHYMLNGEKYLVNFEYQGQEQTTVDIDCGTFVNALKRGAVEGRKVDPSDAPLSGALFGLFFAGTEDFSAEAAIMTDISDKNGHFSFAEIPFGEYVVREIESPSGYILSDEVFPVSIDEDGKMIEITAENGEISFAVSKQDVYGKELVGAKMQLLDASENVVDEWTSDGSEHVITRLPAGSYTLKEVAAPDGYVIATDIAIEIDLYGNVTSENVEVSAFTEDNVPLIIMIDEATRVSVSKQDMTTGTELPGAKLQLFDAENNLVEEWISGSEPHLIEAKLTAEATYTLREITAPEGYEIAEDVTFTVKPDGTITEVVMKDAPAKVNVPSTTTPPPTGDPGRDPIGFVLLFAGVIGLILTVVFGRKRGK